MTNIDPRFMSAVAVIDTLNAENKALRDALRDQDRQHEGWQAEHVGEIRNLDAQVMDLRKRLTVATVAAQAASTFYWAEWAGEKTYLTPAQVKERFADAMVEYREATGVDNVR